jgi:hypothetical protein
VNLYREKGIGIEKKIEKKYFSVALVLINLNPTATPVSGSDFFCPKRLWKDTKVRST